MRLMNLLDLQFWKYNLFGKSMFATRQYFTEYLLRCNQTQISAEKIRQTIAQNPYFQVVSVFQRFDKFRKGYLEPADFSEFMLQNKIYPTQSEIYLIFRDFDRQRLGIVNLDQFELQILPRENRKLKKDALKRNPYPVELKLSVDLQYLIGKYFEDKINTIKQLSGIATKIKASKQYAIDDCFLQLDSNRIGYLSGIQEIDNFLRKNGKALKHEELIRIFRVLSLQYEREITMQMFREQISPFEQPLYPGYLSKVREKEALEHRFLEKKYVNEVEKKQNIYRREELEDDIANLRDSNRRLRQIMQQQQIVRLSGKRGYYPYI